MLERFVPIATDLASELVDTPASVLQLAGQQGDTNLDTNVYVDIEDTEFDYQPQWRLKRWELPDPMSINPALWTDPRIVQNKLNKLLSWKKKAILKSQELVHRHTIVLQGDDTVDETRQDLLENILSQLIRNRYSYVTSLRLYRSAVEAKNLIRTLWNLQYHNGQRRLVCHLSTNTSVSSTDHKRWTIRSLSFRAILPEKVCCPVCQPNENSHVHLHFYIFVLHSYVYSIICTRSQMDRVAIFSNPSHRLFHIYSRTRISSQQYLGTNNSQYRFVPFAFVHWVTSH